MGGKVVLPGREIAFPNALDPPFVLIRIRHVFLGTHHVTAELHEGASLVHDAGLDMVEHPEIVDVGKEFGLTPEFLADEDGRFLVDPDRQGVLALGTPVVGIHVDHDPVFGFVLHRKIVDRDTHVGLLARFDARRQKRCDAILVRSVAEFQHGPLDDLARVRLGAGLGSLHGRRVIRGRKQVVDRR